MQFYFFGNQKNLLSQMNDVFYVPDPICSVCHSVKLTERQKHERSELDARTFEIQGETVSNNRQTESRSLPCSFSFLFLFVCRETNLGQFESTNTKPEMHHQNSCFPIRDMLRTLAENVTLNVCRPNLMLAPVVVSLS